MATLFPLEVTVRDVDNTEAINSAIEKKAEKLQQLNQRIEYCKVVAELAQNSKHTGKLFNTRITVDVPGKKLVSNHAIGEDLYVVIRDAFNAMYKQLESYSRKQQGDVKTHPVNLSGTVDRLFSDYGFIKDHDGIEYYFSADNVMNVDYKNLQEGHQVRFFMGDVGEGMQATHVSVVQGD